MDKTVVELFAGVGGFRVGLQNADPSFKFVLANQWEPGKKLQHAYDCYTTHFGLESNSNLDVSKIDEKNSIASHTLLVGGFPCQDYSVARTGAQGMKGKKGVLWWDIIRIANEHRPPFLLLENVDRLLKSPGKQRGRDFGIILGSLKELGYCVEWRVINAAEYGFPQRRRRVFIFAYHQSTNYARNMMKNNNESVVKKLGFFQSIFETISSDSEKHLPEEFKHDFTDLVDLTEHFKFEFQNAGAMIGDSIYTEKLIPIHNGIPQTLGSILETDVDERFYLDGSVEKWQYLKGAKKIERTHKEGHKYTFAEGPIAFPDYLDKPSRTMLTSESSLNRSTHIIEDPQTKRFRKLTPVECERLNGFPDNWTNTGMPEKFRYFCMGNALVVGLVEMMGREISKIIENEK